MHARTTRELGAIVRGERRRRSMTQAELALAVGTSRTWIIALEQGKPSVELGLVLRTLNELELATDIVEATVSHGEIDLDALLDG